MCRLITRGTQHGCGHYVITEKVGKVDCRDRFCSMSTAHPKDLRHCHQHKDCKRYYGPDAQETVAKKTTEFCTECEYWFKGPGRREN